jgi:FkbM family methyltransferase
VSVLARRRDAVPLFEQFSLDTYGVELPFEVRSVLDLGANVGFAAVALGRRHSEARFACVEPDGESRRLLEENLRRNGVNGRVIAAAVVGEPGSYRVAPGRVPASNAVEMDAGGDVAGLTVADILRRAGFDGVDLMKIDVEGAEWGVFADAPSWAPRVRAVIGELHPVSSESAARADALLAPCGFRRVALPNELRFRDVCLWIGERRS